MQWFWMTGALKGFQARNVCVNLSGAWTNNSERVWIIYTPLLVLSSWQLGHRDFILNCLEHYSYFELILGSLIFRLISVRWIGMQNLPYLRHFSTHLWKTILFYFLFFFLWSVRVAERLALPTSDHGVAGSNPAGGEILPEPKRRFIAQSLSCSPFHRLEMTKILLKGRKTLTHPSIFLSLLQG